MKLADDVLSGVAAISEFTGDPVRRTYHLLETGQLPAFKLGGRWIARKSSILKHFEKLEEGQGARGAQAR